MARRLDEAIKNIGFKHGENGQSVFKILKRFLDELFQIINGTTKPLHQIYEEINRLHPTLKFTMEHTSIQNEPEEDRCSCEEKYSIPSLDTSLSIENGRIEIDLHRKKTDRNQYLLPSSCHPKTTTLAIPYSLSLRIIRICTKIENRDKRLAELKDLLIARDYPENLVTRAIERAKKILRKIALMKIRKKESETRPAFFSIQYDPRLPAIQQVVAKHWRSMVTQNKYLKACFKKQPLTAFRRQTNLRNFLIKSKGAPSPPPHPKRNLNGMNTCGKSCTVCPYVQKGKYLKINKEKSWEIGKK